MFEFEKCVRKIVPGTTFYQAVDAGSSPLVCSGRPSRAVAANTAATYLASDMATAISEVKEYRHVPDVYQIALRQQLPLLDLRLYCQEFGIFPGECYAGERSSDKCIHKFYGPDGYGIPGLAWPSQANPEGEDIVLYKDRCPLFQDIFTVEKIST